MSPEGSSTRAGYDAIAAGFQQLRDPLVGLAHLDRLLQRLRPGAVVVDVGCGTGAPLGSHILAAGYDLIGIDTSAAMIEIARTVVPSATLLVADMTSWDPDSLVHGIVAWDSVFHVPRQDHPKLYERMRGWVDASVPLLLTVGVDAWEGTAPMFEHDFFYSGPGLSRTLDQLATAGWQADTVDIDDPSSRGHAVIVCHAA